MGSRNAADGFSAAGSGVALLQARAVSGGLGSAWAGTACLCCDAAAGLRRARSFSERHAQLH